MALKGEFAQFRYTYKGAVLAEALCGLKNGRTYVSALKKCFKASELVMLMEDGSEAAIPDHVVAPHPDTDVVLHDKQIVYLTGNRVGQEFELFMIKLKRTLSGILGVGREAPAPHED